jgi:hypothetical protein
VPRPSCRRPPTCMPPRLHPLTHGGILCGMYVPLQHQLPAGGDGDHPWTTTYCISIAWPTGRTGPTRRPAGQRPSTVLPAAWGSRLGEPLGELATIATSSADCLQCLQLEFPRASLVHYPARSILFAANSTYRLSSLSHFCVSYL